ncbi:MraY family glycosyltransferase, partial [Acidimangrovimonas pyrenivorans]
QGLHGHLSHDDRDGVQKLHRAPVPRVGGLALLAGQLLGGLALPAGMRELWWAVCLSVLPAFAAGLAEDITKRVGVRWRLAATILAGLLFSILTGYSIARVGLPGADALLALKWFAIPFTAFAIGGIANALNIIDGVNGLASGSAIIVLSGFALVAAQSGDGEMLALCLVSIGALAGFFVLNFPLGKLFLGDAGAYSTGFVLAVIAVMLPLRNPQLSPLIGLLALAYPVIETMVSIHRRTVRKGTNPGQPDRLHLHSLVYRHRARSLARALGLPHLRNAMTSVLLWLLPLLSVA